jgi:hypothetical protein
VTPFISFFSLVALALVAARPLGASPAGAKRPKRVAAVFAAVIFLGLYDQSRAAVALNDEHDAIRQEWNSLGDFVRSLEARLPTHAMVFQLPALTYLSDIGREKMIQYDQIKPYIVSERVHWSYPALSDPVVRWQQQVSRLPTTVLTRALANQGFAALLIDRDGYADRGHLLLTELGALNHGVRLAESERYIALDLNLVYKAAVPVARLPRFGLIATGATASVPDCGLTTTNNLEWIGETSSPFATPPVAVRSSGEFFVTGWAIDERNRSLAGDVDIVVDDTAFSAFYGADRPDVADYLGNQTYRASGFTARIPGGAVSSGANALSIRILSTDRSCYYQGPEVSIVAR